MNITMMKDKLCVTLERGEVIESDVLNQGYWCSKSQMWIFPKALYHELIAMKPLETLSLEERLILLEVYMYHNDYKENTIKVYVGHLRRFLFFSQNNLSKEKVDAFVKVLIHEEHCSHSYVNQLISSIKVFGQCVDMQKRFIVRRPKREYKLPKVMTYEEIQVLFNKTESAKYKLAFMMAYFLGLRVSEIAFFRTCDFDDCGEKVFIAHDKRTLMIPDHLKSKIKNYIIDYQPGEWLFENKIGRHLSTRSLQKTFKRVLEIADLSSDYTFHSLRHSYATHMMASGMSVAHVQRLLGHISIKTTEKYLHVAGIESKEKSNFWQDGSKHI